MSSTNSAMFMKKSMRVYVIELRISLSKDQNHVWNGILRFYGNSYKIRIASVLLRNKTKATRFEKVFFRTK